MLAYLISGWCAAQIALNAGVFAVLARSDALLPPFCHWLFILCCAPLLVTLSVLGKLLRSVGLATKPSSYLDWDVDLRGQVCVVTGCNRGIGKESAVGLACLGATVVMACRSKERAEKALAEMDTERTNSRARFAGDGSFVFEEVDLDRLASVRSFASRIEKRFGKKCNILVNNAGSNGSGSSQDGYGAAFQSNFLGHFHLTLLLLPRLQESARTMGVDSRIVFLTSSRHHFAVPATNVDELEIREGSFQIKQRKIGLSEAKLYNLLLAAELRRKKLVGVRAIAVNPGCVCSGDWPDAVPSSVRPVLDFILHPFFLSTKQGCATSIAAAAAPERVVPRDAIYLSPYRCYGGYTLPFDLFGSFIGAQAASPSLPEHYEGSGEKLWKGGLKLMKPVLGNDFPALMQCLTVLKS